MESANLHHQHQLQDQLVIGSSSLATPSFPSLYGVGSNHAWNPNATLNITSNFNQNISRGLFDSSDSRQKNDILVPSLNSSMIQDLGFHWIRNAGSFTNTQSAHDLHLTKSKEELSADSFPRFTEMINSSSSIEDLHLPPPTCYIKNEHKNFNDLSEKLLLKTLSSGCQINGHQHSAGGFYYNAQNSCSSFGGAGSIPSRGNFSQIFPSINISNLNQSSSAISNSTSSTLDMNLQALDLVASARFSGSICQPSHDNLDLVKESLSFSLEQMQQLTHMQSNNPNRVNISAFINGVTEAKRPSSYMEAKASKAAPKKSRLESRASFPPFKVRKEKLGDRIAALQQLVAPFGKTDTASVLMEAIGYIKFLQNQVETLSVPYMKSSHKRSRTMQVGQTKENGNEEPKPDLRSRGLCLVPLSCMSYITNDVGGGGIWPPIDCSTGAT